MQTLWPWITLALLGAFHGLNPGMGWLFAVAIGLQERSRSALMRSFVPIALGHALSIAIVVALIALAQPFVDPQLLAGIGAAALIGFGIYKLVARQHPRWVAMRVGARQLLAWSFLMATAHGAGLMLVPVLLQLPQADPGHAAHIAMVAQQAEAPAHAIPAEIDHADHDHAAHAMPAEIDHADHDHAAPLLAGAQAAGLGAVTLHTAAMFVAMAGVAVLVYEKLGLAVLRRAWFNLDLLWAWSLIVVGALSLLL